MHSRFASHPLKPSPFPSCIGTTLNAKTLHQTTEAKDVHAVHLLDLPPCTANNLGATTIQTHGICERGVTLATVLKPSPVGCEKISFIGFFRCRKNLRKNYLSHSYAESRTVFIVVGILRQDRESCHHHRFFIPHYSRFALTSPKSSCSNLLE